MEHVLRASMERGLVIEIIYANNDEITQRNIKVIGITGDSVKAFCYLRNQYRVFKLSNILNAAFIKPVNRSNQNDSQGYKDR